MVAIADRFLDAAEACRRRRERAVDELVARARASGGIEDRTYWSIIYDFEHAPMTTNRRQLSERGVEVPRPDTVSDDALPTELARTVAALARMGIYFIHTDHMDDRTLFTRISTEILDEAVREMPPCDTAVEYVDLLGTSPRDREVWLAMYADDRDRRRAAEAGERVPERRERLVQRDSTLPRPQR